MPWAISRLKWDRRKAQANVQNHGVSFDEAQMVFLDENARLIGDPDHSAGEERFLILGYSIRAHCLIVSHCYRGADSVNPILVTYRHFHDILF